MTSGKGVSSLSSSVCWLAGAAKEKGSKAAMLQMSVNAFNSAMVDSQLIQACC
jgi:hypothetical protein